MKSENQQTPSAQSKTHSASIKISINNDKTLFFNKDRLDFRNPQPKKNHFTIKYIRICVRSASRNDTENTDINRYLAVKYR